MYAWSIGIGTVWIAGTFNREQFEAAMGLAEDEVMLCAAPIGYTAEKMSIREALMRKGVKADWRYEPEELFFDGQYGTPFKADEADEVLARALDEVRWAPSAVNKQPWRIVLEGGRAHFDEKQDKGFVTERGDLQKVDIGIALYHFMHEYEEAGKTVTLKDADPGLKVPDGVRYVVTAEI